tara:strand:- start:242 stop:1105 length:864 start_codon:yes stop_codon:yes gene_type:complete
MPQTLTGTALEGKGSLITEAFDTSVSTPTVNVIQITNTGASTYVNIEAEDRSQNFFTTGSNLTFAPFTDDQADGTVAQSNLVSLGTTALNPDGSIYSWKRGKTEYQFIATSTNPTPADTVEYLSKDNEYRRYKFYFKWSATIGTLGTNLASKIDEVQVDGMDEVNAFFSGLGFFQIETTVGTTKFNNMPIFRNGSVLSTVSGLGLNSYPIVGREKINGEGKAGVNTPFLPFVGRGNALSIFVPNTAQFQSGLIFLSLATLSGTFAANQLRMSTAGPGENVSIEIYGA